MKEVTFYAGPKDGLSIFKDESELRLFWYTCTNGQWHSYDLVTRPTDSRSFYVYTGPVDPPLELLRTQSVSDRI